MSTPADILVRYRSLAPRVVLLDGERPLMAACARNRDNHNGFQGIWPKGVPLTCPACGLVGYGTGYVPIVDLRNGVAVLPLGLLLEAARILCDWSLDLAPCNDGAIWACAVGNQEESSTGDTPEAALAAALESYLDAQEAGR